MIYWNRIVFKNGSQYTFHTYQLETIGKEGIQLISCLTNYKGAESILTIRPNDVLYIVSGVDKNHEWST